ncbi:MAG TPA: hypothetical protein PKA06_14610, partial [Gemmatales bacterium]|nr:hypothetical protein [Gemmatales bacterium]
PFDDPAKELRFQQARAELFTVSDPRTRINWWLLIILAFGVLLLFQQGVMSYQHMGILVGVLLFHEFCHFVLMRSFGYSDLQLYFLPLFSTLLNSRKYVAAAWKQAWVIHIAPLVGIVTALFLYLILREEMTTLAWFTIITLLTINGVNLIPLQFFDAGKFFAVVLFNRNAWIESGVQLISALAIGLFALANRSFYLGLLSLFMLTGTPLIFRRGQMITKLRSTGISLPETLEELQPLHQRMLFAATYDVLGATRADPKLLAQYMRELYYR